jgi:hypothetical protein
MNSYFLKKIFFFSLTRIGAVLNLTRLLSLDTTSSSSSSSGIPGFSKKIGDDDALSFCVQSKSKYDKKFLLNIIRRKLNPSSRNRTVTRAR